MGKCLRQQTKGVFWFVYSVERLELIPPSPLCGPLPQWGRIFLSAQRVDSAPCGENFCWV